MGTYSALGPSIKETVERLKREEKLERILQSPPPPVVEKQTPQGQQGKK